MSYYDLYGFRIDDMMAAKEIVENALKIKMEVHDSSFVGGYFMYRSEIGEEFILKGNFDAEEDAFREPDYQESQVLLYIDESTEERIKTYELQLLANENFILLRREDL